MNTADIDQKLADRILKIIALAEGTPFGGEAASARAAAADLIARQNAKIQAKSFWPFADLKTQGIVDDRQTLRRRMRSEGFPPPVILGPNSIAWPADEVRKWLASRPRGAAPQPKRIKSAAA
jgi:hypothetical protein